MSDVERSPGEPPAPGPDGTSAPTDPTVVAASQDGGPDAREQPEKARPYRSNEFWLAVAGIIATVVVGVTASASAYRTSSNQTSAETVRAEKKFTRDQRMAGYLDFLTAADDLTEDEWEYVHQMEPSAGYNFDNLVAKGSSYHDQLDKFDEASAKVELVGTAAVNKVREQIMQEHNALMNEIQPLASDIASSDKPSDYAGRAEGERDKVEKLLHGGDGLRMQFITAAKADLGFDR
jgi:hypothetical protein